MFNLFLHIIATDVCYSSPCTNGGSCVGGSTAFTCNCVAGFTGPRCEVSKFYEIKVTILLLFSWS